MEGPQRPPSDQLLLFLLLKAINLLTLQELIKFIQNVIVIMDLLLMVSENQFYALLLLVHLRVIKEIKNQESNVFKR